MPRNAQHNERIRSARKEQILDAALTVYLRLGFHGTDMDAIAAEADLAKGLLYYYYKTKRELFAALYAETLETADAVSARLLADTRGMNPVDRLMRYTWGLFHEGGEMIRILQFCMRLPFDAYAIFGPDGWREGVRKSDIHRQALTDIITQGIALELFSATDPGYAANSFWSVFVANVFAYARLMEGKAAAQADTSEVFLSVVQFCFQGLGIEQAVWTASLQKITAEQAVESVNL